MNTNQASKATRFKVGVFTLLGLLLIGGMTVYVNDKPFWWRPCQLVYINVDDATGLKTKSAIRSLGVQIGYLQSVDLFETAVKLGICITAPVEVLPSTRAFIRGEGFLGDKFVELKPVKFLGTPKQHSDKKVSLLDLLLPSAYAATDPGATQVAPNKAVGKEIPVGENSKDVQKLVDQVDDLVNEMRSLTSNLKEAINPKELRATMQQLNRTLENASRTLAPEGGLNTTAQRTLAKLEDAIEQLRDQVTRINRGEGSLGSVLNDPKYAQELHEALKNVNRLLSKVGGVRFIVDLYGEYLRGYDGGRGVFRVGVWSQPDRYYLLGLGVDPRGSRNVSQITTVSGGQTTYIESTKLEPSGIQFTAMMGKVLYRRLDLAIGVLQNDASLSVNLNLGPHDRETMLVWRNDLYAPIAARMGIDARMQLVLKPWFKTELLNPFYFKAGIESFNSVNGSTAFLYGAGMTFDDEDIKLLFAFK